jgi:hypothetical protein
MGQLDSTCTAVPAVGVAVAGVFALVSDVAHVADHVVALQVAFERQILKPAFSLDRF